MKELIQKIWQSHHDPAHATYGIVGQGTGDLYEHLQNLKKSKVTIYVSGISAKSRGYDEKLLDGYTAEFVMPDVLVEESIKADSVLCY